MWRFAAARVTGASHLKRGEVCQDRFATWCEGGVFACAVSDGAGSASRAEAGAEAAVEAAIQHVCATAITSVVPWSEVLRAAAEATRTAILAIAADEGRPERDFACTLLMFVASPLGGAALQIGDGVIALRDDSSGGWSWVFWPHKGEYANTTRFIIDHNALEALECVDLPPTVFEVALMTDGLEALALNFSERATHDRFFDGVLAPLRTVERDGENPALSASLEDFLGSERVTERADDDLTLVIAARALD